MMQNCKLFAFDSYDQVLSQTCDDRKYLIHARKNKMTEQEMTYLFTRMKLLLAKFHGVKFSICTDTVDDLRQLQQKDLTNEFQPIEFKLLVKKIFEIKKEALEADMVVSDDDIDKSNLEDLLKETNHVLEQIEELLDEHEVDDEDELILENKNLKELVERLKGEIDQLKSEELLDNKEEDDVDELRLENQNLHELVKSLKDEIKQLKSENLPVMEESSMLEPEEVTDVGQEMNDMKRQLEWFKSELMNSRATVKRLEKERNRYRKALEDADELTSSMETTAGGFTILSEKSILYGQKVTVLQGNIVRVTADAIAHPTGKNFETRGAVGSELKEAGGEVFLHEVTSLRNTHGPLAISEAAICKGNNFPAEYVIHVHSPGWRHENAQQMLTTATANVLKLADEHNMKSIGIPSISSGHAGFPKLIAAKTILSAITDYFSSNRFSSIRQVFFVLFDAESVTAYITQLQQLDV
ncbi:protein mono-ADP-ribosyltransferase PARP14-like isoform X2 [Mercenaria mercenaria]|nr:protein mono-ADP-ribosyltransferase PARP14-like isoform X2 [Mercenaria mercenaria]